MSYFILGLPRSRTTWLSVFLSHGRGMCHHEKSIEFSSLAELKEYCDEHPEDGIADTFLIVLWKELRQMFQEARIVVIHRPLEQVIQSHTRLGLGIKYLVEESRLMEETRQDKEILHIEYGELAKPEVCRQIYKHCVGVDVDSAWLAACQEYRIETDLSRLKERVLCNQSKVASFYGGLE